MFLGELAAIGTASCWAIGSVLFGYVSVRIGAFTVNTIRIPLAALILLIALYFRGEAIIPADISSTQLFLLSISGFAGLVLGDWCFFQALVNLGPRHASLLAASAPVFAVLIAWLFLNEQLSIIALMGITVTMLGIIGVIMEKRSKTNKTQDNSKMIGIILGFCAGLGQAIGLVLAKYSMGNNLNAMSASLVRMIAAAILIWTLAAIWGKLGLTFKAIRNRRNMSVLIAAAFIGPFIGVWLSLVAVQLTEVGIATTLMALTPILVIPVVIIIHKDYPTIRAVLGTVIAVIGVAIIFYR